jgi:hypothetical protein
MRQRSRVRHVPGKAAGIFFVHFAAPILNDAVNAIPKTLICLAMPPVMHLGNIWLFG